MKNLMKQMVVGGAVVITLAASVTFAYTRERRFRQVDAVGGGICAGISFRRRATQRSRKRFKAPMAPCRSRDNLQKAGSPFPGEARMASAARRSFRQPECFNQTARWSASSRARRRQTDLERCADGRTVSVRIVTVRSTCSRR